MSQKPFLLFAAIPLLFSIFFTLKPGSILIKPAKGPRNEVEQQTTNTPLPTAAPNVIRSTPQTTAEATNKRTVPVDQNYELVALAIILVIIILLGVLVCGWR